MIVQGKIGNLSDHTMSLVIDPFNVLVQLSKEWRESIGVQHSSPIMGGYWMRFHGDDTSGEMIYTRLRLATRDEIIRMDAFKNITEYTALLS